MKLHLIKNPLEIKDIKTNLDPDKTPEYKPGSSYKLGERVQKGAQIYESLKDNNTDAPTSSSLSWNYLGYRTPETVFDGASTRVQTKKKKLSVSFSARRVDSLFFFGLNASKILVSIAQGTDKKETHKINLYPQSKSWSEYFYSLKPYAQSYQLSFPLAFKADFKIDIIGENASVALIAPAATVDLGYTTYGVKITSLDLSKKLAKDDGSNILQKNTSRMITNASCIIDARNTNDFYARLDALRATPLVFSQRLTDETLITWAFIKSFDITASSPQTSNLNLELQGML